MYGTYQRLNLPVWASNREVIRAARRKVAKRFRYGRMMRAARHSFYREMLSYHANAQALCREFKL